jgi:glycolate oxidase FAD binding subunit
MFRMILAPSTAEELSKLLADASARDEKVTSFRLNALQQILEHTPEDMTVTTQAGVTLADLQAHLAHRGQWLPIDPPHPEQITVGSIVAMNVNGPRRMGYGTIRDYLLGIKVVLADGRLIKAGGRVVKNVAGYDLCKVFVGSHGTLGAIVEATFKLRPLPEREKFVQRHCQSLEEASSLLEAVRESVLTPTALDLHNLSLPTSQASMIFTLVLGFAGTDEEVAWQIATARDLGISELSDLQHEHVFWANPSSGKIHRSSLLPSKLVQKLRVLREIPFVARAGNGIVYSLDGPAPSRDELPAKLMKRIKDAYDPKHIFPEFPQ